MSQDITQFFSINEINQPLSSSSKGKERAIEHTPEPEIIALDFDNVEISLRRSPRKHPNSSSVTKIKKKKTKIAKKQYEEINKKAKENLTFNESWRVGRPWLIYQQTDDKKGLMFCSLCKNAKSNGSIWSTTGCDYMKIDYVKRHEKSKEHKDAVVLLDPNQTGIKEGITKMLNSSAENILTQMRNIYFLSAHHLALNVFPDLSQFVTYQTQNTGIISSDKPLQILRPPILPKKTQATIEKKQSNYATYTNK
ncbi:11122_t:CDS:1, partial [Funneliformis caledonium]